MKVYEHTCDGCRTVARKSYDGVPPGWWKVVTAREEAYTTATQRLEKATIDHACSTACVKTVIAAIVDKLAGYTFAIWTEYCR